jgi:hypothetical protein
MVPYEAVLEDLTRPRWDGLRRLVQWIRRRLWLGAPALAGCTPIGDAWSPGMIAALLIAGGAILFLGWRYYLGGDDRRARRQERRDDRRD